MLCVGKAPRASKGLSFGLCSLQPGLGALNQKIALKLGNGSNNLHRHTTSGATKVNAAKGKAMHPNTDRAKAINGLPYVRGIAA